MKLTEFSNAADFLAASSKALMRAEAENNLLLSSARTLARSSSGRLPKISYFVVSAAGQPLCAALNVCGRRLLLSTSHAPAARFLGEELGRRSTALRAVLGPASATSALSAGLTSSAGLIFVPYQNLLQRRLTLRTAVPATAPAPGLWRTATGRDLKLLLRWSKQFVDESGHDEPLEETEEVVRRYLENKQLFIWDDHRPVAMAGYGGFTPNGARINMVYTDPSVRSRGYARSLVSALGRKLLAPNRYKFCFLFVTAENHPANRVYEKLGYEKIGAFTELRQESIRREIQRRPHPTSARPESDLTVEVASRSDFAE